MSGASFNPERFVLANGLTVLTQHKRGTQAVSLGLSFAAGATFDPQGLEGLSSLVARGLIRGTAEHSKHQIGEVLDDRGAHMAGSAGRHTAGLGARCRRADFEAVLALLAECARTPTFPDPEVERMRGDRLTALREDEEDPATVVGNVLRELAYPAGHPYARRSRGTADSIAGVTATDLREFHAQHYDLSAAALVVVGDLSSAQVRAALRDAFGVEVADGEGGYRVAMPQIPDVPALSGVRRKVVELADRAQVDVALGHVGIRRDDPRYYAVAVMNMVLGRFAMGGRLGRSVREEQGMAYYTYSMVEAGLGPGPFVVRAGVQAAHVEPAVASILAEIERIRSEPVEAEELENAKFAMVRSLPRMLESNEGIAGFLHQVEMFDLGLDYLDRYADAIGAVDVDGVTRAAREVLDPERYALAIAGPYSAG